ncbi:Gldg family protein [Halobellus ruber]|uniref:DUF4350 domain-containing protein n=1 Tax=Halobellus ruber TaxID=2761102 RepID=A0A7J9SKJ1_9EURY|nr:hypothetical protein [Halobellus ruber]MBB6647022.1 hypothetical protein [Halobellus ruber]
MPARDLVAPAVAFVVLVAAIVGGAAAVPFVTGGDSTDVTNLADRQTDMDAATVAEAESQGEITMDSDAESKTVLVDRAHANRISDEKLSTLVTTLVANGHEVEFVTQEQARGTAWNESLRSADALVIANPNRPYTPGQLAGVQAFAEAGGRVVMLSDPASIQQFGIFGFGFQRQSNDAPALASEFGLSAQSGYLFNMHQYQQTFKSVYATPGTGPLAAGVDRVVVRDAAAVSVADGQTALQAGERTRLSTTRRADTYGVAVRSGSVAMVGDTDFLTPESAYVADNEVFIGNLADFLVSGEKTENAPAPPSERSAGGGAAPPRPPAERA